VHLDEEPVATEGLDADTLRDLIEDTAGVADVEVDLREDGSPRLRIRLDGSASTAEVGAEIRRRIAATPAKAGAGRRNGLGRGLADILAADAEAAAPVHLQPPAAEPQPRASLVLVAVEETAGGISVRAADSEGGVAFSPVEDPRSLNQAVVSAVGRLYERRPLPRLAGVEIRDVNGAPVLTVVLSLADGTRAVGAALVERGMPFTLGAAVWEALASVD
jgi:hypothetical protein